MTMKSNCPRLSTLVRTAGSRGLLAAAVLLATGCGKDDSTYGYGGGGENKAADAPESSGGDTGTNVAAPVITNLSVTLEDYADLGDVFEFDIYFEDSDSDFPFDSADATLGGKVLISLSSEDGTDSEEEVAASALGLYLEDGYVRTAISPEDSTVAHTFSVIIVDAAGNASDEAAAEYTPAR